MAEFKESEHPRDKDGKFTDKAATRKAIIHRLRERHAARKRKKLNERVKSLIQKRQTRRIGLQFFANKEKQFGKKVGKHARDFGLDPSLPEDREKFQQMIDDIVANATEVRTGEWRGQPKDVNFHILGNDVVLTDENNEFISILKGGVNNARVKKARVKKI